MTMLLLLAFLAQEPPKAHDIPRIVDAVLAVAAPADGRVGTKAINERTLFVGATETVDALRAVVPTAPTTLGPLTRAHTRAEQAQAVTCVVGMATGGRRSCAVVDDGIFVSVVSARSDSVTGQLVLLVRVRWTFDVPGGTTGLQGYDQDMFVGREGERWRVVRTGAVKIVN